VTQVVALLTLQIFCLVPSALLALIVLLPPLRRFGQVHLVNKWLLIAGISLFSALIPTFSVVAGMNEVFITFNPNRNSANLNETRVEIWLRSLAPPFFKQDCFTNQVEVCKSADDIILNGPRFTNNIETIDLNTMSPEEYQAIRQSNNLNFRKRTWLEYLTLPGFFLLPSLIGSTVAVFLITDSPSKTTPQPI